MTSGVRAAVVAAFLASPTSAQCPGDIVFDGRVDGGDLGVLLSYWGPVIASPISRACDLNSDQSIDGADLGVLLASWGNCSTLTVEFRWRIHAFNQWCTCSSGCVPPGGVCLPEQSIRLNNRGQFLSEGPCPADASAFGQVTVNQFFVEYTGAEVDSVSWSACTANCCTACTAGSCYVGGADFVSNQQILFSSPVWPAFDIGGPVEGFWHGLPQQNYQLIYTQNRLVTRLPFTNTRADFNADGVVDGVDLAWLFNLWGQNWPRLDLNDDGEVNGPDLADLLSVWGPCPN